MTFQNAEVPFVERGNRQVLTAIQCLQEDWIMQFVKRFPNCFAYDITQDVYVYYPDGDSPHPVNG